jgi:hypothetical protein
MNFKQGFFKANKAGLVVVGCALLGTLAGCVGYVDRPGEGSVYVDPAYGPDDYVYYPNYQVYYSTSRHQYAYLEGNAWVSRPAPRGVSVDVLLASPSVRMDFHDSPANHHAQVVRQYPKNWRPSDQQENRRDDQHDDGGNNHGR